MAVVERRNGWAGPALSMCKRGFSDFAHIIIVQSQRPVSLYLCAISPPLPIHPPPTCPPPPLPPICAPSPSSPSPSSVMSSLKGINRARGTVWGAQMQPNCKRYRVDSGTAKPPPWQGTMSEGGGCNRNTTWPGSGMPARHPSQPSKPHPPNQTPTLSTSHMRGAVTLCMRNTDDGKEPAAVRGACSVHPPSTGTCMGSWGSSTLAVVILSGTRLQEGFARDAPQSAVRSTTLAWSTAILVFMTEL